MRLSLLLLAAFTTVVAAGCVTQGRGQRERGAANLFEDTREVKAPPRDRCQQYQKSSVRGPCDEAKFIAQKYVRGLAAQDEVCLEGGFGEHPGGACLARAVVSDVSNDRVLLDIRDAQPNSRWYSQVSSEIWFAEGALIDLYLGEHGY
ncbi:MAG: hypothetical protein ACJ790_19335 [Myxococcaceae bacterium]